MSTTIFQGSSVVLSFLKDTFLPYKCFSDITIELATESQAVATVGDGHWAKNRYKGLSWTVSLSGPLMLDASNFTGFDILENQIGFTNVTFLASFYDQNGVIKSVQGEALVDKSSLGINPGNLVKDSINLIGHGELKYFDGTVPCPSTILTITPSALTDPDGNITIGYTYSGAPYQIKYRLDGTGPWTYETVTGTFDIPLVSTGTHTIEIIPVCLNNYEGTGLDASFTVTHGLTCALGITSIVTSSITGSTVVLAITFNADPSTATYKYRINDGSGYGAYVIVPGPLSNPTNNLIISLPIGSYTIEVTPICANTADGTPGTHSFNVTSSSTISTINYSFTAIPGGSPNFQIYVNGSLAVNLAATGSGTITAPAGSTVLSYVQVGFAGRDMSLNVTDSTTSVVLYNHSQITPSGSPVTDSYSYSPNGDTYSITAVISP